MDLVCLHGINNTGRAFDRLRAELPAAWRITTPDLPALTRVEEIAAALLADLPDYFILLGHSFGGYVALALLEAAPERVAGLILVNSGAGADGEAAARMREIRAQEAEAGGYAAIAAAATAKTFHPDSLNRAEIIRERSRELAAYGPVRFAAHSRASAARPDRSALAAAWGGPKLVIAARQDAVIPADRQQNTARTIGADIVLIDGAGHMAPSEAPAAIAQATLALADRCAPVTTR